MKILLLVLGLSFCFSLAQAQKISAPVLLPIDAKGLEAIREKSKDRILVLNFWATWCKPCVEEFPELLKLQREYRRKGLDVVFVSIDDDAKAKQKVLAYFKKIKFSGQSYIKEPGDDENFINAVNPKWNGGLPVTLVYAQDGRLVEMIGEQANYFELEKIVKPLLW